MNKQTFIVSIILLISLSSFSQCDLNKVNDSLIQNFLIVNKVLIEPVNDRKVLNGKVKQTSNYYAKEFFLKGRNGEPISVIIFGAYREHPRDYLLIVNKLYTLRPNLFLGIGVFEDEVTVLNDYFKACNFLSLKVKRKLLYYFSTLR